jgi:hypothetical protein
MFILLDRLRFLCCLMSMLDLLLHFALQRHCLYFCGGIVFLSDMRAGNLL